MDVLRIKLVQVGTIQPNILDVIVRELNRRFKSKFFIGEKVEIPAKAYDKFKEQYDAEMVVKALEVKDCDKVIGVTSHDLYYKNLNFVFGVAGKDTCIVSTARLDPKFYGNSPNFDLLIKRTLKEIIHELGHMFGLEHCSNPKCVMSFSNSVAY
ncbi:MAG TPA: hypothetical protein ENF95_00640, partial [Candidatus Aenigmarchaeota archaeon]|nr:hypothetical protein [Candidatus Aenigmarchaeota archaeon]